MFALLVVIGAAVVTGAAVTGADVVLFVIFSLKNLKTKKCISSYNSKNQFSFIVFAEYKLKMKWSIKIFWYSFSLYFRKKKWNV